MIGSMITAGLLVQSLMAGGCGAVPEGYVGVVDEEGRVVAKTLVDGGERGVNLEERLPVVAPGDKGERMLKVCNMSGKKVKAETELVGRVLKETPKDQFPVDLQVNGDSFARLLKGGEKVYEGVIGRGESYPVKVEWVFPWESVSGNRKTTGGEHEVSLSVNNRFEAVNEAKPTVKQVEEKLGKTGINITGITVTAALTLLAGLVAAYRSRKKRVKNGVEEREMGENHA